MTLQSDRFYATGKRKTAVRVSGRFAADDLEAVHTAALGGLGIARLPESMVAGDLERGTLVAILPTHTTGTSPLNIVHAGQRFLPTRTRALIDFLVRRMATRPPTARQPR